MVCEDERMTAVAHNTPRRQRYAIDATRIMTETGWEPAYTFETGIEQTIRWYLDHRAWCDRIRSGEYRRYYAQHYRD